MNSAMMQNYKKGHFFDMFSKLLEKVNNIIVKGRLSYRVSKEINDEVVGKHAEDITNDIGKRLIQICQEW